MKQPPSNGSGKFKIVFQDMGGWVRVRPSRLDNLPPDFAVYLSHSLAEWFRQRPHLHLCGVVPICQDGNTVELHAWFDAHLFPPTTEAPRPDAPS